MSQIHSRFLTCADRTIHFLEAGDPERDTVVIWHGVTGSCRDHVDLVRNLATDYHVICPDSIGCGLSDWVRDPDTDPGLTAYAAHARALLDQLGITSVRWIGASKGGGLGLILADIMDECPISHLVLNDVGPGFPERLRQAAAKNILHPPQFKTFPAFADHLRALLSKGGLRLDEDHWQALTRHWCRRTDTGQFTFQNDPALAHQFTQQRQDFDLWSHYDRITAKTLLIRAEQSLIPEEDLIEMRARGPRCQVQSRPGGHISLMTDPAEQTVIRAFLKS